MGILLGIKSHCYIGIVSRMDFFFCTNKIIFFTSLGCQKLLTVAWSAMKHLLIRVPQVIGTLTIVLNLIGLSFDAGIDKIVVLFMKVSDKFDH